MKLTLCAVSMLLVISACDNQPQQFNADVEVPVTVVDVGKKPIEEFVETTGTVKATKDFLVQSETAGFYKLAVNPKTKKLFALGDTVRKNQVIIYIDNPEQENIIKIESSKLNLDISKREYEKQQSLYDKGGVTLRELKDSERSYIDAQYNHDNALINLAKMKIISPFGGVIVDLPYYTQGVKLSSGTDMVHIMNYAMLNMEVNLPANLMSELKVNQLVRVMNYTIPDNILEGAITQISPALDPETRTFKATVDIDNPDWILRPGMFVKVEIVTASKDSTVVIPKGIIISRRNRKSVFIIERSIARERVIEIGLENPDEVEIIKGLNVNERLVVTGFETLRNGSKVKINQ